MIAAATRTTIMTTATTAMYISVGVELVGGVTADVGVGVEAGVGVTTAGVGVIIVGGVGDADDEGFADVVGAELTVR